jgi:hypothetical protein
MRSGVENPLRVMLQSLMDFRAQQGKSADGQRLLAIIQDALHIDARQLGALSLKEQQILISEAAEELAQEGDRLYKFHALSVLACVDLPTNEDTLIALMRIAFAKYRGQVKDELGCRLAATALARRVGQPGFDITLARFLQAQGGQFNGSLDNAKKLLLSLSLRPSHA